MTWKDAIELVGIGAVVASLIFVGLQMRQTHEIALATLYQMRSDAARELRIALVDPTMYEESASKARSGQELDEDDVNRLIMMNSAMFNHFENTHYLFQLGFIPAEHWDSDKRQLARLLARGYRRDAWQAMRGTFRDSFVAEIDVLIKE